MSQNNARNVLACFILACFILAFAIHWMEQEFDRFTYSQILPISGKEFL